MPAWREYDLLYDMSGEEVAVVVEVTDEVNTNAVQLVIGCRPRCISILLNFLLYESGSHNPSTRINQFGRVQRTACCRSRYTDSRGACRIPGPFSIYLPVADVRS